MMHLRVGTSPWLLRHEIRLAVRGMVGSGFWLLVIGGGLSFSAMHFVAWAILRGVDLSALPPSATMIFGTLTWGIITLMLAQAIMLSVDALFGRGDLDLLLASPIAPRVVFLVRSLGIAIACVTIYLLVVVPFANVGLVTGRPRLLAVYPALIALGLAVTAAGMVLTLSLVRWLGARRARTAAQIIGAIVGASLFLASQVPPLLGAAVDRHASATFRAWFEPGQWLEQSSIVWLPFRALLGEPLPLLTMLIAGIGGLWLVANLACRQFLADTQASVTGSNARTLVPGRAVFHTGLLRNVLVKEWKLIWRDPNLIAQTLLQTLYLVPFMVIMFRRDDSAAFIAPACILIATSLVGNLAWLTVAAEDAPELIGSAPVKLARLRWTKVLAAIAPVWLLLSPIALLLAAIDAFATAVFVFCLAGATLSAGLMQIWYPQRGKRSDLKRRLQSARLITMLEAATGLAWTATAWLLLSAPLYAMLAAPFVIIGPGAAWMLGEARRNGDVALW